MGSIWELERASGWKRRFCVDYSFGLAQRGPVIPFCSWHHEQRLCLKLQAPPPPLEPHNLREMLLEDANDNQLYAVADPDIDDETK